jgi:uncharacterized damage-inducible protein DinB
VRLVDALRIQARANRLANHRLHAAMAALPEPAWLAPRVGFFGSLAATLNHILAVDLYYIGALWRDPAIEQAYQGFVPAPSPAALAPRQRASDERLIAFCDGLADDEACDAEVEMDRGSHVQRDRVGHVLAHLFMHQTHHRGQAHAMLSGTEIAPPQLDEFLLPSDAPLRSADMAALGWRERDAYRPG